MDQNQMFSKEITVNKSLVATIGLVKEISSLKDFTLIEDNAVMNKETLGLMGSKIEVSFDKLDEERTKIHLLIRDKNDNYFPTNEISSNIALNFENGLTCIVKGQPDDFKVQPPKLDSASGCVQLLLLIVAIVAIILGLRGLFS
jgi:hypothetical protein